MVCAWTWLSLVLCCGAVSLAASGRPQFSLELELTDGSRLLAEPIEGGQDLRLRTRLGELTVPLSSISSLEILEDRQTLVVHWADGDRLTGAPVQKHLELKTVLGPLQVPLAAIVRARIKSHAPAAAIEPAGVQVSGQWSDHQKPEMAIDGEEGTAWSSGDWRGWIELDLGASRELARVDFLLQFDPAGPATHEVYVSDQPLGAGREKGRLIERLSGPRENHARLSVALPSGVVGRYVQIHCPHSVSWFNIREVAVFPRN